MNFNARKGDYIRPEFFEVLKMDLKRIFVIKQANEIATNIPTESKERAFLILDNLFNKFHNVAQQLRDRYNDRETLLIEDEYDVQDLLHALLRLHFKDIRPEDYTPSNSGSNSRRNAK